MLSQRRVLTAHQAARLAGRGARRLHGDRRLVDRPDHLYYSALHRAAKGDPHPLGAAPVDRPPVRALDIETLINIPTTMLIGIGLVIFAFALATPISQMATTLTRLDAGLALASVLLSFLDDDRAPEAVPQVIGLPGGWKTGFSSPPQRHLWDAARGGAGRGARRAGGTFIFGIFFFHIRERFDAWISGTWKS